ncbi:hypothetical protein ACFY0R_37815 [Streptomyces sp. NPDC001633]|uniref:hypothetical protein n=1 Tax=Streptomyces sp. NPDC001633 TaxID=3364595 RepID=UPI0036A23FE5
MCGMTTPSEDPTTAFLRRAEEINQQRMKAVEPLAELVARRNHLRQQLDALEETYGRQYVEAEKAGWTEEELTAMEAEPPVRRPRGRPAKKTGRKTTQKAAASPSGPSTSTGTVPGQQTRTEATNNGANPADAGTR